MLASVPDAVFAPVVMVIVPAVSLPSIVTVGAAMLLEGSAVPAAVSTVADGVFPAVMI